MNNILALLNFISYELMECFRLEAKKCPVVMVADVCTNSNVRKISSVPVSIVTRSCCLISIGNCFDVFVNTWVNSLFLGTDGYCVTTPCCRDRKHHYMRFYIPVSYTHLTLPTNREV